VLNRNILVAGARLPWSCVDRSWRLYCIYWSVGGISTFQLHAVEIKDVEG